MDRSGPENSPQVFIQQVPADKLRNLKVYLDAGEEDARYLDATRTFHDTLDRLKVQNKFNVFPGGHGIVGQNVGWNYWHKHLSDSLAFVGQQFKFAVKHHNRLKPPFLRSETQPTEARTEDSETISSKTVNSKTANLETVEVSPD